MIIWKKPLAYSSCTCYIYINQGSQVASWDQILLSPVVHFLELHQFPRTTKWHRQIGCEATVPLVTLPRFSSGILGPKHYRVLSSRHIAKVFKWHPRIKILPSRGVARLFKMRGRQGGAHEWAGGADWYSKWWLSMDLCTKCNFIWGQEGGRVSAGGSCPPAPWLHHCYQVLPSISIHF